MNEYLTDLFNAFKKVDIEFYFTEALLDPKVRLDGANDRKTFIQLTERQFSAELYHNWRLEITTSENRYTNLKIGFEVSKKFIENKLVQNKSSFTPDLVLHQSQVSFDPNFQKIYLEIKTNPKLSLKRIKHDLNKILFSMNQYGFQNGVFISVNSNKERLIRIIKRYMDKNKSYNNYWKDIYLFHSVSQGDEVHIDFQTISEL